MSRETSILYPILDVTLQLFPDALQYGYFSIQRVDVARRGSAQPSFPCHCNLDVNFLHIQTCLSHHFTAPLVLNFE
jgi:hypothetical protein